MSAPAEVLTAWPITMDDVLAARDRIRPHIAPTPLRAYAPLDDAVGGGVRVWVKHENHCPTNAFKARNGMSAMTALTPEQRRRGVVAATRGNHGQGLAWAGQRLGVPVTVCVPFGNNPEKNEAMRGYGAELIEAGADYDEAVGVAAELMRERGMHEVHSTNDPNVISGAATATLEIVEEMPELDALVIGVGGGSQAVGAMTVARALRPGLPVYAVGPEAAPGNYASWRAGRITPVTPGPTLADGMATRGGYETTFEALRTGLAGFVTVSEAEIAEAMRLLLRTTHNLAEGSGAVPLAGIAKLRDELAGKRVAMILSGGNVDAVTLRRVLNHEV